MNKTELLQKADELEKELQTLRSLINKEEDIILVPDKIKISNTYNKTLAIHNGNQRLYYAHNFLNWCVGNAIGDKPIKCKLTPCKYEDLEPGDVFYRTDYSGNDFKSLNHYAIKLNGSYQFWQGRDCINGGLFWSHYWKVEAL